MNYSTNLEELNNKVMFNSSTIPSTIITNNDQQINQQQTNNGDHNDYIIDLIDFYYTPIIIYMGIFGNILSVYVFFATKLKKLSSTYYLAALAISDCGFLLSLFTVWLKLINIDVFNKPILCQTIVYLSSVFSFLSVWLIVAFTVERFIAVQYPLLRASVCTVQRARYIVLTLTITAILLFTPHLVFANVELQYLEQQNNHQQNHQQENIHHQNRQQENNQPIRQQENHQQNYHQQQNLSTNRVAICKINQKYHDHAAIFNIIDTFITFLIPIFIIAILNSLICRTVWKLTRVGRQLNVYYQQNRHKDSSKTLISKQSSNKYGQQNEDKETSLTNNDHQQKSNSPTNQLYLDDYYQEASSTKNVHVLLTTENSKTTKKLSVNSDVIDINKCSIKKRNSNVTKKRQSNLVNKKKLNVLNSDEINNKTTSKSVTNILISECNDQTSILMYRKESIVTVEDESEDDRYLNELKNYYKIIENNKQHKHRITGWKLWRGKQQASKNAANKELTLFNQETVENTGNQEEREYKVDSTLLQNQQTTNQNNNNNRKYPLKLSPTPTTATTTHHQTAAQTTVTKMLLIVSTVFLCLNLPSYVMRILIYLMEYKMIADINPEKFGRIQHCCLQFFYTSFGINFVLYCLSGQNFRKALHTALCNLRHRRTTNQNTPVHQTNKSTERKQEIAIAPPDITAINSQHYQNKIEWDGEPPQTNLRSAGFN